MRRKDKRLRGIYDKNVFFVKRYMSPEFGSHFTLTTKKEICNDYERFKFYLKVGGIAFLDKVSVPGQWLREAREKLRESNHFGSYLFYSTTNKKLRVVIYAKKTLYTIGDIMLSRSSLVHSVIPRYDGERYDGQMIKGMKLDLSSNRSRKWEKYDSNEDVEQHDGLHYIYESFDLTELKQDRTIEWGRQYKGQTGIYVPKNTTLLLQDGGRAYAHWITTGSSCGRSVRKGLSLPYNKTSDTSSTTRTMAKSTTVILFTGKRRTDSIVPTSTT